MLPRDRGHGFTLRGHVKLIAGMLARNESWALGMTARAVLQWCDELIILDHASTDDTRLIAMQVAWEHPKRVAVLYEPSPVWEEMRHRQRMLDTAREHGATHFAIVDSDEILTANLLPKIRGYVEETPARSILMLPWVCLARGPERYYSSGIWYRNWVVTAFQDAPQLNWSASIRGGYDFHQRSPFGCAWGIHRPVDQALSNHQGGLMHLQFVNERRLKAKQYLYQLTERLRWPGREPVSAVVARYRPAIVQSDPFVVSTAPAPIAWWGGYSNLLPHFHAAQEPWQIAEISRLLREKPELAVGLDDFGLRAEMAA